MHLQHAIFWTRCDWGSGQPRDAPAVFQLLVVHRTELSKAISFAQKAAAHWQRDLALRRKCLDRTHTEVVPKWSSQQGRYCFTPWRQSWENPSAFDRWESILFFDFPFRLGGRAQGVFGLARASGCWWGCTCHFSHSCKDCSSVGPNKSRHCDSHTAALEMKTILRLQISGQASLFRLNFMISTLAGWYMIHAGTTGVWWRFSLLRLMSMVLNLCRFVHDPCAWCGQCLAPLV